MNTFKLSILSCFTLFWSVSLYAKDFGAWGLICEPGDVRCSITQVVASDSEAKHVLLGVSINYFDSVKQPTMSIRVTPEAVQKAGLGLKVDKQPPVRFPFAGCNNKICVAKVVMDKQLIDEMENGKHAVVAYLLPSEKQMLLPLSMSGFSEAFKALNKAQTNN